MAVQLNHTLLATHDKAASAAFLAEILGLAEPLHVGPFAVVQVGEVSLDYRDVDGDFETQHYAFLVTEAEFDEILGRVRERRLTYWADPARTKPGEVNGWDGGRGVYFDDPNGHLLEVLTRPYGSGGTTTSKLHPLFVPDED